MKHYTVLKTVFDPARLHLSREPVTDDSGQILQFPTLDNAQNCADRLDDFEKDPSIFYTTGDYQHG